MMRGGPSVGGMLLMAIILLVLFGVLPWAVCEISDSQEYAWSASR